MYARSLIGTSDRSAPNSSKGGRPRKRRKHASEHKRCSCSRTTKGQRERKMVRERLTERLSQSRQVTPQCQLLTLSILMWSLKPKINQIIRSVS